ncbi:MAG: hypothetical protein J4A00_09960 [Gammaproteobacteria bacterium]|nr:hypothetical protein [Gammaproteobacteria bacterium]
MKPVPIFFRFMRVLWPSFLGAGAVSAVVFSLFDPGTARLPDALDQLGVMGVYTLLFFLLWLVVALACWVSTELGHPGRR